jgi:hypothetical protein
VKLRIFGSALFLAGTALAFIGITGYLRGPSIAAFINAASREFHGTDVDWCNWLRHWKAWATGIGFGGLALAVSGAALATRRRWGFLLLAIVLTLSAIVPWLLQALKIPRYTYERAGIPETLVTLVLAVVALLAYIRGHRLGVTPSRPLERRTARVMIWLIAGLVAAAAIPFGVTAWGDHHVAADGCSQAYSNWSDSAAFKRCQTAANMGGAEAEFGYGLLRWSGPPAAVDRRDALDWLRKSARQGHWLAQTFLGGVLQHPELESGLRNRAEAYAWLVTARASKAAAELRGKMSDDEIRDADRLAAEFGTKYPVNMPGKEKR